MASWYNRDSLVWVGIPKCIALREATTMLITSPLLKSIGNAIYQYDEEDFQISSRAVFFEFFAFFGTLLIFVRIEFMHGFLFHSRAHITLVVVVSLRN